jgi:pimeloyl-ACP methyl ester carboxylesterase
MKCRINGVEIYYERQGQGCPLVMIHGFSLDHRVMVGCMEPIFSDQSGFQRIYFDLPGMGQTPANDGIQDSEDMLKLVIGFIKKILPDKRFSLVGESYGGYLARGVANRMQSMVDGMLLICPVVHFARTKRTVAELQVLAKDRDLMNELSMVDAEEFQNCVVLQTRNVWNRFQSDILPGVQLADFSLLERVRDTEFSFDPESFEFPFTKPVSILLGRFDNSVGYRDGIKLFGKYPRASLVICDRAGHNLQIEQESIFKATANEWLQRLKIKDSPLV